MRSLLLAALLVTSCSLSTPSQAITPLTATETPPQPATPTVTAAPQDKPILIWLAPHLAPDTAAGQLLAARLASFEAQIPNLRIEVRIKPVAGPGGMLNALEAASVAAPQTVPDLLTMPQDSLRRAAELALIQPLPEDLIQTEDPRWYDYALPPSRYQGLGYGLPFASEVDVLAYRKELYPDPPRDWEILLAEPRTLLFPAADPRARFIMAMYLGAGGNLVDESGRPALQVEHVEGVLRFLATARTSSALPLAVRQYASPLETWTELKANRSASAMAPLADFLREGDPQSLAAVALPTESGGGIGLAWTWSWAMTASEPGRQELLTALMTWLSEPGFTGALTNALGFLPTTQDALAGWPEDAAAALASSLVTITRPTPEQSIREALAPALMGALEAVLGAGEDPALAAQNAVNIVANP